MATKKIRRKVVGWNHRHGMFKLECGHEIALASQNNSPNQKTRRCYICERVARAEGKG